MLFLLPVLCLLTQERGGIMSLTEVYCLVNRARGLEVRHCFGSIFCSRTSVVRKLKRVKMFPTSCSFYLSTARCDQLFIKIRGVLPFSFLILTYNTYVSFTSCDNVCCFLWYHMKGKIHTYLEAKLKGQRLLKNGECSGDFFLQNTTILSVNRARRIIIEQKGA